MDNAKKVFEKEKIEIKNSAIISKVNQFKKQVVENVKEEKKPVEENDMKFEAKTKNI